MCNKVQRKKPSIDTLFETYKELVFYRKKKKNYKFIKNEMYSLKISPAQTK